MELIPTFRGRPSVVKQNGWVVFLSVHDSAYLRELKRWRGRLAEVHPDKGGSGAKFRKVMGQKLRWQHEEAKWYAELGLLPPDGFKGAVGTLERRRRLRAGKDTPREQNAPGGR